MASHSILSLRYIVNRLRDLGVDPDPVLAQHGLDLNRTGADSRIDTALELRIFCSLAQLSNNPLAGLQVGNSIGFTGYGPFSLLLLSCRTPYEVMQCSLRYHALAYLFSEIGFELGSAHSDLTLKPYELPGKAYRLRIDMELAGAFRLLRDLRTAGAVDLQPDLVCLPYPQPVESRAYEEFFGCPVRFGDHLARIRLSNGKLQQPMASADAMANEYYRQECEKLSEIALRESSGQIAEKVREHLLLFQDSYPDAPAVASFLGMSERSLRNRLGEQGTSFRKLLDAVRFQRACEHLSQTGDPIEAIALRLGYAETSSFIHAFQRWSGSTPSAYRRSHASAGR